MTTMERRGGMDMETCETCGYWGGCDSKGDTRRCYQTDPHSDCVIERKHKDDVACFCHSKARTAKKEAL